MKKFIVTCVETCGNCKREGIIYDPQYRACGARIPSGHPWWNQPCADGHWPLLPCGHSTHRFLREEFECPACHGTGEMRREVDLKEALQAIEAMSRCPADIGEAPCECGFH